MNMPLYMQIYEHIKQEIIQEHITVGSRLPSHRKLSEHLQVSRNTVELAYAQLVAEGYVHSIPKKGLYAADLSYDIQPASPGVTAPFAQMERPTFDFSQGLVDASAFPITLWKRTMIQCLYDNEKEWFTPEHIQGEIVLREQLTNYLYQSRGVVCTPEQIVFGAGTQLLLSILVELMGVTTYAMEEPGFHRARAVLQNSRHPLTYVEIDEHGLSVQALRNTEATIVYITPSHQFPYGMIMPVHRRLELLDWAKETDGYIIEDDYDGEFRYIGRPIPALQGLDASNRVIYLGTFSKAFLPAMRMSYMVLPPSLLEVYKQKGALYKQTVSKIHQLTMYHFMKNGHWQRHLNRMRTLYKKKQKKLISSIQHWMGTNVTIIGSQSGLHIVLDVKNGMTESELIQAAARYDIKVYPLSVYYANPPFSCSHILLGFGGLTEQEIEVAISLLHTAWFG
ncbi:PLP-dependent aminotransferase family protein [Ectobacillus sp. JY-23]|uniref:MocR-like pyridoxine biosynthesis transcription factor PdxR n=1 Tax=Ectobacillus sp. JY-23 TaxID=2933872 RepID=UPI001FF26E2B|nr:PLP-dependent aminotransferase family protein [Ectobacillus sp. JY-23]UOY94406.1 PLP-dependent aminotransferase family protein [Ectobacillus sp. JY-23]